MRLLTGWLSVTTIAVLGATAQPVAAQARLQDIVCESTNNSFRQCPVQTGGYAQLVQNISNTRCEFERTWGFDYNGIWVDRGCRGRFRIGGRGGTGWQSGHYGRKIVCESRNNRYQFCEAETRGDVRLTRQLSSDPCTPGRSWGFEQAGIWVNNGCRAEFEIGYSDVNWVGGNRTIVCESRDGQYSRCRVWTYGEVRLTRQLSNTRCIQNNNWGFDQNGIWVNGGCRAEFTVGRGGGGWGPGTPGPGPGGSVEVQGRAACLNKARSIGYTSLSTRSSNHLGSIVRVEMRGSSQNRQFDLECTYRVAQRTATINKQSEVGYGGGNSDLFARAAQACDAEARRQRLEILGTGPSKIQTWGVLHSMAVRRGNTSYRRAGCSYVRNTGQATISLGTPEAGGGGNDSEMYGRAAQACDGEARRQGYIVLGSGPSRLESWGVQHKMALRRGGVDYHNANCNYQSNLNRATVVPGPTQPEPRVQPR